ncbi:hypothetical protein A8135_14140 [Legionella jamestowniensis]|uniref:Uncharacterized protein n=1 Tax=Legionella jamestowniensis TaxID=455 RepID=A0ABX2XSL8_9GAMM|nr:hypothetical protein [Legionella jamestowniensis]OCH97627.1 hypothetical protein A8135_14140 [Legionella jamestowniensis]
MILDVNGFDEQVSGGSIMITVDNNHRLIKLAQKFTWDEMLQLVLPDLQHTDKKHWWIGRPFARHSGQLGRSRMKSDETIKSVGYAAVFGFNLRQLTRCLAGDVRPKVDVVNNIAANNANIIEKMSIQLT